MVNPRTTRALHIARLATKLQVATAGESNLRATDIPSDVMGICTLICLVIRELEEEQRRYELKGER